MTTSSQAPVPVATLLTLAWRNLWRNYRRTAIMLVAISIGVWAMIFVSALMRGMMDDILNRGIDQLPGHVQIHHPLFLDDPSVANSIDEPNQALRQVLSSELVNKWFSRVKVPAVIGSEQDTRGVTLLGIDPRLETTTILGNISITSGEFLQSDDDKGIVIGARLAERLETRLGKRVVITSQDPDNNLVESGMRIVGIYQAELRAQEEMYVYLGKYTAQELLNIPNKVSEIAAFANGLEDTELVYQSITSALGSVSSPIGAGRWDDINGYLGSTIGIMDGFVLIWIIVIFMALSFGLANTLVMAIFERVREIGLMLALGMRPLLVMGQILFESLLLLLIGLMMGNFLSLLSVHLMGDGIDLSGVAQGFEMAGMGTTLYPLLNLNDMLTANIVVIVLGLLTSLLPAWRAAHYDPVQALSKAT